MKKSNSFYFILTMFVAVMFIFVSCTKEGPAGPAGADGTNGTNGEDGIDGTDGTATCIQCHDDTQVLFAKTNQWENSIHATGGTFARNGTSCAPCHVSQGFLERMAAGTMETAGDVLNPNPINCYTCHWIHRDYEVTDIALTYSGPVDFWHTGESAKVDIDFGKGNLCANCHQSRIPTPWPAVGSSDTYTITSFRFGPHHGPMAQVLGGFGGYEVPGSKTYTNSAHTNIENACIVCHMADSPGVEMGGHVMNVAFDGSLNEAGCSSTECHPDGIEDETIAEQEEVHIMLEDLHNRLITLLVSDSAGYLLGEDGVNRASSSNPANLSADYAGAFFNFKMIEEDRSGGVHNLKYSKALLTNSLEAIQ